MRISIAEELQIELDRLRKRLGCLSLVMATTNVSSSTEFRLDYSQPPRALSEIDFAKAAELARSSALRLESDAIELTTSLPAFSAGLVSWNRKVRVGLTAVNPTVLPDDLVTADEFGSILPWAFLAVTPHAALDEFDDEIQAAPSPRAFLASTIEKLNADAAILWIKEKPSTKTSARVPHMVAAESIGASSPDVEQFTVPIGRGIVGRFAIDTPVKIFDLKHTPAYNKVFVTNERWRFVIGGPVVAGGLVMGALTVYTKKHFSPDQALRDFESLLIQSVPHVRRHRKINSDQVRDREIKQGLERLQIGVEILGFAHDLANSAAKASKDSQDLAKMLSPKSFDAATRAVIEQLQTESGMVHRVTRSMNRLAKQRRPERTTFDLARALAQVKSILIAVSDSVDINVPTGFNLYGDPLDVQRILINLVTNAKHWTPNENAVINVKAFRINTEHGDMVELSVEDNGSGMTIEQVGKATTMLYTTRQNGLGLGLYVVKDLTDRLGGDLRIASKPHVGTKVTVRLPLVDAHLKESSDRS